MKLKLIHILAITVIVLLGVYISGYTNGHKKEKARNVVAISDTVEHYKHIISGKELFIAEKEQELATERQARKMDLIEKEELKKLNLKQANELTRLRLRVDTLLADINHNGTIVTIHDTVLSVPKNCILLPFSFTKKDEWLSLQGEFSKEGKLSLGLTMDANLDIWTGIKKGEKLPTAIVTTTNPYLKTIGINSVKMDTPKIKKYAVGIFLGYGVSRDGLSPILGLGVGRSLIRF